MYTITAVLVLLYSSPFLDIYRLSQSPFSQQPSQVGQESLQATEGLQARSQLNLVLTLAVIGGLFMTRRMGCVLAENARLLASEEALKRQVVNFQQGLEVQAIAAAPEGAKTTFNEVSVSRSCYKYHLVEKNTIIYLSVLRVLAADECAHSRGEKRALNMIMTSIQSDL